MQIVDFNFALSSLFTIGRYNLSVYLAVLSRLPDSKSDFVSSNQLSLIGKNAALWYAICVIERRNIYSKKKKEKKNVSRRDGEGKKRKSYFIRVFITLRFLLQSSPASYIASRSFFSLLLAVHPSVGRKIRGKGNQRSVG